MARGPVGYGAISIGNVRLHQAPKSDYELPTA